MGGLAKKEKEMTELEKRFQKSLIQKDRLIAWYSFNGQLLRCNLNFKQKNTRKNEIVLQVEPNEIYIMDLMISGNDIINFYIPSKSIHFKAILKNYTESGQLSISMPYEVKEEERRRDIRVEPDIDIKISFMYNGNWYTRKTFDVSAGGFSIVFGEQEKIKVEKEQDIGIIKIDLLDRSIIAKAQVATIMKLRPFLLENCPYGGQRISFMFTEIEPRDRAFIAAYINTYLTFEDSM